VDKRCILTLCCDSAVLEDAALLVTAAKAFLGNAVRATALERAASLRDIFESINSNSISLKILFPQHSDCQNRATYLTRLNIYAGGCGYGQWSPSAFRCRKSMSAKPFQFPSKRFNSLALLSLAAVKGGDKKFRLLSDTLTPTSPQRLHLVQAPIWTLNPLLLPSNLKLLEVTNYFRYDEWLLVLQLSSHLFGPGGADMSWVSHHLLRGNMKLSDRNSSYLWAVITLTTLMHYLFDMIIFSDNLICLLKLFLLRFVIVSSYSGSTSRKSEHGRARITSLRVKKQQKCFY